MKVKFIPTVFELNPSQGFSKNVGRLFLRGNKFHLNGVVFNLLTSEMVVYFEVFGFFMKYMIVTKFYATLIVAIKVSGLIIQKSKFF